jgi:hypothetical protein
VQEIALQHGGQVTLLDAHPSHQPPGTCVHVRLPMLQEAGAVHQAQLPGGNEWPGSTAPPLA